DDDKICSKPALASLCKALNKLTEHINTNGENKLFLEYVFFDDEYYDPIMKMKKGFGYEGKSIEEFCQFIADKKTIQLGYLDQARSHLLSSYQFDTIILGTTRNSGLKSISTANILLNCQ